ncbi:hypothetical protein BS50DRAFT_596500 [Corynespora cassiicola Philippines]|uniref:WW domain-containing protein n=1 Tax=Corynespora cassiicola Philippines TaxID=1448308 RepID=A0A2T2PDB0_CORCC|nr:hypothetical protein BS50DRAFT_596500 [Corynespora cassiicola Philippines]
MSDLPARPPPPAPTPALAPGWTAHTAPSGHTYYYNRELKKSTYKFPAADIHVPSPTPPLPPPQSQAPTASAPIQTQTSFATPAPSATPAIPHLQDLIFGSVQQNHHRGPHQHNARGGHHARTRGDHGQTGDRRRDPKDRPKHREDIPNCAPWVLVRTKLKRRFVWNKETNESFWKFPPHVMKAVIDFDRVKREKKERRERGEPSDDEQEAMADIEADLAAAEEDFEERIVEVDGDENMEFNEEYEEVEVTDDEGDDAHHPSKRQRTEEPVDDQPMEMGEDDMAWQLAQMEAMEAGFGEEEEEEEGLPLTEEDCKALFKELLDDLRINPYSPWDKLLEDGLLYDDERYKALPNMKARKECFDEWARERIQWLKEQKAKQQKVDPRIPYLAFLHRFATPKLYWPEFRRKYKKEPEMKDMKLPDKEKEKLYREHVKRLGMRHSDLSSDLSAMLKAQPLAALNRSTTLETLPPTILTDVRFISLPSSTRDSLIESYISTLPSAPEGAAASAEEEAEMAKKRAERQRREQALAERERRVREEKRKHERELAYSKGRLHEEEMEIERAMNVGKQGLKSHLDS